MDLSQRMHLRPVGQVHRFYVLRSLPGNPPGKLFFLNLPWVRTFTFEIFFYDFWRYVVFRVYIALVQEIQRFLSFRCYYLKIDKRNRLSVFNSYCRGGCLVPARRVGSNFLNLVFLILWSILFSVQNCW